MAINTFSTLKTAVANWLKRDDLDDRTLEFIALGEDRIWLDTRIRVRDMERTVNLVLKAITTISASELTGTANALIFTPATAATEYALGDNYSFTAEATNTDAVTVNISAVGSADIKRGTDSNALEAGDIIIGTSYNIYYDGSNFILLEQSGGVPLPQNFLGVKRVTSTVSDLPKLSYSPPQDFWLRTFALSEGTPTDFTIEGDVIFFRPVSTASMTVRLLYYRKYTALSSDSDTNWLLNNARGLYLYAALLEASPYIEDDGRALTWATLFDDLADKLEKSNRRDRYPSGMLRMKSNISGV